MVIPVIVLGIFAATLFAGVLFLTTDWWEIMAIAVVVGFIAYLYFTSEK